MFLSLAQSYSNLCVLKTHCMQAAEQFNKAYTEETLGFVTGGRLIGQTGSVSDAHRSNKKTYSLLITAW